MKTPKECPVCGAKRIHPIHAQGLKFQPPEDNVCLFDPTAFRCERGHMFLWSDTYLSKTEPAQGRE
jgi:hypothetical protein